jgi:sulfatase modifying factor 1
MTKAPPGGRRGGLWPLQLAAILTLTLAAGSSAAAGEVEPLVLLAQPGPWSAISGLIGYGNRLWFVDSTKFVDHNSADVYSYDPALGRSRYERHLFSQDAGDPIVANGLLYWPFEDARFSAGRGEYAVTNGREWQWRILPDGQVFHVHAMAVSGRTLYAATSAWHAGLQRSDDGGVTWRVVYDHPTPGRLVSRLTALAVLDQTLYAGLTAFSDGGAKLLRADGDTLRALAGWPRGESVDRLTVYRGWLYAVNVSAGRRSVWRTDGKAVERITDLDGRPVRALAPGEKTLWAVTGNDGGGALWHSTDGMTWGVAQRFSGAGPVDVTVYGGRVYVGTIGPNGRGALWGPAPPAPVGAPAAPTSLPPIPRSPKPVDLPRALDALDRALASPSSYQNHGERLRDILHTLVLSGNAALGVDLGRRLDGPFPSITLSLFGGQLTVPAAALARWYLLWAIARSGHGRVPPALLSEPWIDPGNRAEKYLGPAPAAAWAAAELRQVDDDTLGALVARLGAPGHPPWLDGDFVGALTALTGQRFGYDLAAWRDWWTRRSPGRRSPAGERLRIPRGVLMMGSDRGTPAERPVHRVTISAFWIDRLEVTNADFAAFVAATAHVTDPERAGVGWHWDREWREVPGADWRHPHGPGSSIGGLERHPVVQVSWRDADAYCRRRHARLPTEAEWERAARGNDSRTYPWGDEAPRKAARYRASYGSDECCRADPGDGYLFTAPVGSFPLGQSPFAVQDLAGNVWEWVQDWFDPEFYSRSPAVDPVNRTPAERTVIRGGGWGNDPWGLRSTLRHANPPDIGLSMVGFRCAR